MCVSLSSLPFDNRMIIDQVKVRSVTLLTKPVTPLPMMKKLVKSRFLDGFRSFHGRKGTVVECELSVF